MSTTWTPSDYNVSMLAKLFHSVPHYDLTFGKPVPAVFEPNNPAYQEALLIIAAVPVLWMLLWMLIYMVYFCYFCITCRTNYEKKSKSSRPERWLSFVFALFALLFLTATIFGNELIDSGVKSVESSVVEIYNDHRLVRIQAAETAFKVGQLHERSGKFKTAFKESNQLERNDRAELLEMASLFNNSITTADNEIMNSIVKSLKGFAVTSPLEQVMVYEHWRRIGTHILSGVIMLCLTVLLCAIGTKRKCFVLFCVGLTMFNVVLIWCGFGAYMATTVATADVCVDPSSYLTNSTKLLTDNPSTNSDVVDYYLHCPPIENPITDEIARVQTALMTINRTLTNMHEKATSLGAYTLQTISDTQEEVKDIHSNLLILLTASDCTDSHRSYLAAVRSLCGTTLNSEIAIVGGYGIAGIFLIMIVFLAHAAARYVPSRRAYFEVESREDYPAREEANRSDNPLYYRFSQISTGADGGDSRATPTQPSAPKRNSPPPAYQPHGDFYSSYGNNGTLDSNTNVPTNDLNSNGNTFR